MARELASIVYTVYNQVRYVREALVSALTQSYEPLEVVVSDDASTDGTQMIIDEVVAVMGFVRCTESNNNNPKLKMFRKGGKTVVLNFNEKNLGICENFEYAFGLTQGELVFAFGGDDISSTNRVEKVMAAWIAAGKTALVATSGGWLMGVGGKDYREYRREVLIGAPVGAFNAYARCVYEDFPKIDPKLAVQTYEDCVYGLRAQFFAPPVYIDELLVHYRFGSGVSTGGAWRKKSIRGAQAVKASCEQLLNDLEFVKDRLPIATYEKLKTTFAQRIAHEMNYLEVLSSDSFLKRWRAFRRHGFLQSGIKGLLLGGVLLFPKKVGDSFLWAHGICAL